MIVATEAKAAAIRLALDAIATDNAATALLLAMLTSPNREQREQGKANVRRWIKAGEQLRLAAEAAGRVAAHANRGELD